MHAQHPCKGEASRMHKACLAFDGKVFKLVDPGSCLSIQQYVTQDMAQHLMH